MGVIGVVERPLLVLLKFSNRVVGVNASVSKEAPEPPCPPCPSPVAVQRSTTGVSARTVATIFIVSSPLTRPSPWLPVVPTCTSMRQEPLFPSNSVSSSDAAVRVRVMLVCLVRPSWLIIVTVTRTSTLAARPSTGVNDTTGVGLYSVRSLSPSDREEDRTRGSIITGHSGSWTLTPAASSAAKRSHVHLNSTRRSDGVAAALLYL